MELLKILQSLGVDGEKNPVEILQFQNAEDGAGYLVWKVCQAEKTWVLKQAKGQELEIYAGFFDCDISGAPRFFKSVQLGDEAYFLMEYVQGGDLRNCSREKLKAALDALIDLQQRYWEDRVHENVGTSFATSLVSRKNRGCYLGDAQIEEAYAAFLELYKTLPRTLCHDDLLPFNVLVSEEKAVIIDWECAGILPYPTSLARLIAHGEEREDAFFFMKEEDKSFAIEYYYEKLIKKKGICYENYRKAIDAFLLYEYCEWIMVGNRYGGADMDRYQHYLEKAKAHIQCTQKMI